VCRSSHVLHERSLVENDRSSGKCTGMSCTSRGECSCSDKKRVLSVKNVFDVKNSNSVQNDPSKV